MSTMSMGTGSTRSAADDVDAAASGVSWPAVFAGAAGAAALSMILLVLGAGLGFATVSPWTATAGTAGALGAAAIGWIAFTSIAASALGGYLAGRLRGRWSGVHGDEVYFRDTAHGFLAWAVASLVTAAFLGSAISGVLSGFAKAGGEVAKGAATMATVGAAKASGTNGNSNDASAGPAPYFVDSRFRSDAPAPAGAEVNDAQMRTEATRIFANGLSSGVLSAADVRYLGQVVARRTGLPPAEADKRVADTFTQTSAAIASAETKARQVADDARKAAAATALWMFVALLAGAFFASLAALFGGRQRDDVS